MPRRVDAEEDAGVVGPELARVRVGVEENQVTRLQLVVPGRCDTQVRYDLDPGPELGHGECPSRQAGPVTVDVTQRVSEAVAVHEPDVAGAVDVAVPGRVGTDHTGVGEIPADAEIVVEVGVLGPAVGVGV
jgi:hypothetical protein